jgi:rhodanese-related sulfurtransferase
MIFSPSKLMTAACLCGFASCADPVVNPPVGVAAAEPTQAKPPRMNGRGKVTSISLTDAFALQQTDLALILDARPAFFYHLGHIPGASNLPKSNALAAITKRETEIKTAIADGKSIIVYCTNFACPDARSVARHLASFGFSSATLTGGWDAWQEGGLPTESSLNP